MMIKTEKLCIENNLAILSLMIAASLFVYGVDQHIKYHDDGNVDVVTTSMKMELNYD